MVLARSGERSVLFAALAVGSDVIRRSGPSQKRAPLRVPRHWLPRSSASTISHQCRHRPLSALSRRTRCRDPSLLSMEPSHPPACRHGRIPPWPTRLRQVEHAIWADFLRRGDSERSLFPILPTRIAIAGRPKESRSANDPLSALGTFGRPGKSILCAEGWSSSAEQVFDVVGDERR
jgi:hypothetical protein